MQEIKVEPFNITIRISSDKEEAITWIKTYHPNDIDNIDLLRSSEGLTLLFEENPKFFMYYQPTSLDHELIHLTWFILEFTGIKITHDNHEIQSYLFEYLKKLITNQNI